MCCRVERVGPERVIERIGRRAGRSVVWNDRWFVLVFLFLGFDRFFLLLMDDFNLALCRHAKRLHN